MPPNALLTGGKRSPRQLSSFHVIQRFYLERSAMLRAIAPAWPFALAVVAVIFILQGTDQGVAALLISAAGHPFSWRSGIDADGVSSDAVRTFWFGVILGGFALAMTLSSLFSLSIRRWDSLRDTKTLNPSKARMLPDPIHMSVRLRRVAAFSIGMAAPVEIVTFLLARAVAPTAVPMVTFFLMIAIVVFGGIAAFLGSATSRAMQNGLWGIVRNFQTAHTYDRRREFEIDRDLARAEDPTLQVKSQEALRLVRSRGQIRRRLGSRRVAYAMFHLIQWILSPACLAVVFVFALGEGLAFAGPLYPGARWAVLTISAAAIIYLAVRDYSMRVVGLHDRRQLIVDRKIRTLYRSLLAIALAGILITFWSGYLLSPSIFSGLGPASALLLGLFLVASVLGFFVRCSLSAIPDGDDIPASRMVPRRSAPSKLFRVLLFPGRCSEALQRALLPNRVFGYGIALLVLDKALLPLLQVVPMESLAVGLRILIGTLAILLAVAIGFVASIFVRTGAAGRFASGGSDQKFESAPRIASLVLLAPFLLATLGQDRRPAYVAAQQQTPQIVERLSLKEHAKSWLAAAQERAGPTGKIPAVVVLAEGGGIRAAAHAGDLLAAMDAQPSLGSAGTFHDDLYVLSGVSGGAIGVSAYLAARGETPNTSGAPVLTERVRKALDQDLLTPLIAGLFGADFVSVFIPVDIVPRLWRALDPPEYERVVGRPRWFANRADFFENALRRSSALANNSTDDLMGQPMSVAASRESVDGQAVKTFPVVVLFSSFGADGEIRAAASNVTLAPCFASQIGSLTDVQSCIPVNARIVDMPLVTAAHMSARFPGISPPAIIDVPRWRGNSQSIDYRKWRRLRFVDGGYFDNSGAVAASEAVAALREAARGTDADGRLEILVLHIFIREPAADAFRWRFSALEEVSTPLDAVWSARRSSALLPVSNLCRSIADTAKEQERCANLAPLRTFAGNGGGDEQDSATIVSLEGVNWIGAPLSNIGSSEDPRHLLLGWLLSSGTHKLIFDKSAKLAARAHDAASELKHNWSSGPQK